MANLYLCGTPIGNLEDITYRAIETLKKVDLIAAEDTRQTKKLCYHFQIATPLTSYHEHNKKNKTKFLVNKLLAGENIALVSDAGTPIISDPGIELVQTAIQAKIKVIPIPGAVAGICGLIASGLSCTEFLFLGFLSSSEQKKRKYLQELVKEKRTMIFYEAPHRLHKTLTSLYQILGNRKITIAKEITKKYENFWYGTLAETQNRFLENKGEFTLIVAGAEKNDFIIPQFSNTEIKKSIEELLLKGISKKESFKIIAKELNLPKNEIYKIYYSLSN